MPTLTLAHSFYGCDTGCCGWELTNEDGKRRFKFEFWHPQYDLGKDSAAELTNEEIIAWARVVWSADIGPDDVLVVDRKTLWNC